MPDRNVTVTLESSGGKRNSASGVLHLYSTGERALRTVLWLVAGLTAAAVLIPVPVVHLLGIPAVLILGIVFASRQLAAVARLQPLSLDCPNCNARNRVGGGLGVRKGVDAVDINCDSCRRGLTLRFAHG